MTSPTVVSAEITDGQTLATVEHGDVSVKLCDLDRSTKSVPVPKDDPAARAKFIISI